MPADYQGEHNARGVRLAIAVSRFNEPITKRLLDGALQAIDDCGGEADNVPVAHVPGALELGVVARRLATSGKVDAVICLGCVIRGQTGHYDTVVDGTRQALARIPIDTGVPVIFGVLTVESQQQALDRTDASAKHHAGADAARGAIEMANLLKKLNEL